MPKALPAPEVLSRARTALMHAQAIDLTAIPKCPTRSAAIVKKRGFLRQASDYARRFAGKLKRPPGCTLEMQREGTQIYEICQQEWPDPNTLPDGPEPYDGEVLDVEVVLRLVGPTFAPALAPGEMHCWVSGKAGGIITEAIEQGLAGLDPELGDVWRAHEVDGDSIKEVAKARELTREQVRIRWAKTARRLRSILGKSGVLSMLSYAIGVAYVPYGELDPDWWSVKKAAQKTGYSTYHLRHLIKAGQIEAVRVGRAWRIRWESMEGYVAGRGDGGAK